MCGIAGIIRLDGPGPVDQQRVAAMANAIFHRGPDEDGVFSRPGLVMANRRLSIVGLADGRQPIHNEDRARAVIAELNDAKVWGNPIVTEVSPLPTFYPAEEYHQGYFRQNP